MSNDFTAAPSAQKLSVGTASPSQLGAATSLRPDEERFLAAGGRCEACGHLKALHNSTDDGESCNVRGCRCDDGRLPQIGPHCAPIQGPRTAPSPDAILLGWVEAEAFGWYRGFDLLSDSASKISGLSAVIDSQASYGGAR